MSRVFNINLFKSWSKERIPNFLDLIYLYKIYHLSIFKVLFKLFLEYKARRQIVKSLLKEDSSKNLLLSKEQYSTLLNVSNKKYPDDRYVSKQNLDNLTNEIFYTVISKEKSRLIAEERKENSKDIISQAVINRDGSTSLTLSYSNSRYIQRKANIEILNSPHYPQTTLMIYKLLFKSL